MTEARLGPGAEFDVIRRLRGRLGDVARDIGDDAAVFDVPRGDRVVASTDTAIEAVHFRRDWLPAEDIAARAVTAALSDLAAMGAAPLGVLVALALPADSAAWIDALGTGIARAARAAGTVVLGGNVAVADALAITTTVFGSAYAPLERSAVRAGDLLYVTGQLGGPSAALRALARGEMPPDAVRARFTAPIARIREARWLAARGAHAAIDVSDGLAADAGHLAAASGVAIELDADRVPVFPGAEPDDALAGGEEYELLVATRTELPVGEFAHHFGLPLTRIGRAVDGAPDVCVLRGGRRVATPAGYDHFHR